MLSPQREARWQQIKEVAVIITLAIWGSGALAVLYWHYSGWWLLFALVLGWAFYYPFIRGYIERSYFRT